MNCCHCLLLLSSFLFFLSDFSLLSLGVICESPFGALLLTWRARSDLSCIHIVLLINEINDAFNFIFFFFFLSFEIIIFKDQTASMHAVHLWLHLNILG